MAAPGPVTRARDAAALLDALQVSDPGRPRLTWYGPGGERVELSARVLANWVVKTVNLLGDELGVEPGDRVVLDLPGHWRTVVWQLAVAAHGAGNGARDDASADDADAGGAAGVRVTSDPDAAAPGDVLVTMAALARSAPALPDGVLDYNAEVGGQPDVLAVAVAPLPLLPVVAADDHQEPPRVLALLGRGPAPELAELVLPTWQLDGSVILVHPDVDPEVLAGPEQVTRRWGGRPGIS